MSLFTEDGKYKLFAEMLQDGHTLSFAAEDAGIEIKKFDSPSDFYIYFLVDPRNDVPFYVGKGKGNRANQHMLLWGRGRGSPRNNKVISDIVGSGLKPEVFCIVDGWPEDEAYGLERLLIRSIGFDSLCNIRPGQSSKAERYVQEKARAGRMVRRLFARLIPPEEIKWYTLPDMSIERQKQVYVNILFDLIEVLKLPNGRFKKSKA